MMLLFVIDIAELTERAKPPEVLPVSGVLVDPFLPLLPIPTITPPFISDTPPGKDPLTVRAGVPVELDDMYTPELIVATSLDD
jgi:hypothetical protein